MKPLKIILTIVLIMGLLVTQAAYMSAFSLSRAVEPTAIRENIKQSGLLRSVTDSLASGFTSDVLLAQYINKLLGSKAVSDALTDFTADQATALLKGEEPKGLTTKELSAVMEEGMETLSLSDYVKKSVTDFINQNGDEATQYINDAIPSRQVAEEYEAVFFVTEKLFVPLNQVILGVLTVILGVLLIVVLWRSKKGFLIWGIICAIFGAAFLLTGQMGLPIGTQASTSRQIISNGFDVFTSALTFTGTISAALGLITIVIYYLLKGKGRIKNGV
jgi:hypothetical protein